MKRFLLASACLAPLAALAQTDAGGGVMTTSMAQLHEVLGRVVCVENPYTDQVNNVTGESTGDMEVPLNPVVKVIANGYGGKPWEVGDRKIVFKKVIAQEYTFKVFNHEHKQTGTRTETVYHVYAGGDGPG